jgi:G3E family GTPase
LRDASEHESDECEDEEDINAGDGEDDDDDMGDADDQEKSNQEESEEEQSDKEQSDKEAENEEGGTVVMRRAVRPTRVHHRRSSLTTSVSSLASRSWRVQTLMWRRTPWTLLLRWFLVMMLLHWMMWHRSQVDLKMRLRLRMARTRMMDTWRMTW